jgi:ATPase subunit of ABC transporter with duplicated ATPase domains
MKKINIELSGVCMSTNCKREIIKDLDMNISCDRVALTGRNGVGKSTLLNLIVGDISPTKGRVVVSHSPYYIGQYLDSSNQSEGLKGILNLLSELELPRDLIKAELLNAGLKLDLSNVRIDHLSHGELRKLKLLVAKLTKPEILILDEPTQDLDSQGVAWLKSWLPLWQGALIVASHRKCLLEEFEHFFIMGEQGCSYFNGNYETLELKLVKDHEKSQRRYFRSLNRLVEYEEHILHIARRRARKKQYGRINELGRATSRQCLNQKRDYAQVKHGRMKHIRDSRIAALRDCTKSTRRALQVDLPMEAILPQFTRPRGKPLLKLEDVSYSIGKRHLFKGVNLSIHDDRLAVCGANGTGKTSLLKVMMGAIEPASGRVTRRGRSIGYISQGATNWMLEDSLLQYLSVYSSCSPEDLAELMVTHKFPLALAERPLKSLSPGERLRAALICLFQQGPKVQLLVLDEPTYSLDVLGQVALKNILRAWQGGVVITSHDCEFLEEIGVESYMQL